MSNVPFIGLDVHAETIADDKAAEPTRAVQIIRKGAGERSGRFKNPRERYPGRVQLAGMSSTVREERASVTIRAPGSRPACLLERRRHARTFPNLALVAKGRRALEPSSPSHCGIPTVDAATCGQVLERSLSALGDVHIRLLQVAPSRHDGPWTRITPLLDLCNTSFFLS